MSGIRRKPWHSHSGNLHRQSDVRYERQSCGIPTNAERQQQKAISVCHRLQIRSFRTQQSRIRHQQKDLARQRSCAFVGNGAYYGYSRRTNDGNDTRRLQPILLGRTHTKGKSRASGKLAQRQRNGRTQCIRVRYYR